MANAELEVQRTIYQTLSGDTTLGNDIQGVFDHVPQNQAFPYVVIGDDTQIQWDTDDQNGHEVTVTLHTWSRYEGREQVKRIMGRIYDLLQSQNLSVSGYNTVYVLFEFSETLLDPDGLTRHGVQRFRFVIQE